ncbi:MAG TPA: hypothetical protein VMS71_02660, partial [Candidatus Acidoferrum sp.]|nr:hypothetical protein [Candidatus Acidoferrum sp.]
MNAEKGEPVICSGIWLVVLAAAIIAGCTTLGLVHKYPERRVVRDLHQSPTDSLRIIPLLSDTVFTLSEVSHYNGDNFDTLSLTKNLNMVTGLPKTETLHGPKLCYKLVNTSGHDLLIPMAWFYRANKDPNGRSIKPSVAISFGGPTSPTEPLLDGVGASFDEEL